jgi:hypothetical protein
MKKKLPFIALSALALALAACEKSAVSGTVIDPFSGKAVDRSSVQITGTEHNSQINFPGGLPEGKFKFEGVKPGTYTLVAGKNGYTKGRMEFTVSEGNLEITQDIYIYDQKKDPGLYRIIEDTNTEKIATNDDRYELKCKGEADFALRTEREEENLQTKKKEKKALSGSKEIPSEITLLYRIRSQSDSPIEAVSYPVISATGKNSDCPDEGEKETLLVPDTKKGTVLASVYKSDNLYEIKSTLPAGEQFLVLRQSGKLLRFYYLNAK